MLMQRHDRVPRFQRELCRSRKREKTPHISRSPFEPIRAQRVADNMSRLLVLILDRNPCRFTREQLPVAFHFDHVPDVQLRALLRRIFVSTHFSPTTASISTYYLYNYLNDESNVYAFESPEIALVAALMIANKAYDDVHVSFAKWSQISNLPTRKLLEAEQALLEGLDWTVYLTPDQYYAWGNKMHQILVEGPATKHGAS